MQGTSRVYIFAPQLKTCSKVQAQPAAAASCLFWLCLFEAQRCKPSCHVTKHLTASPLNCARSSRVDICDIFSVPFSIPLCYTIFEKQRARFFAVRCKHAKPILLMRVETLQRRGSSPASQDWESFASEHRFLASCFVQVHVAWIAEAPLRNMTTQAMPSVFGVDGQEGSCSIMASRFIFSQ